MQSDFFLQPVESPPARLQDLIHWLHVPDLKALFPIYTVCGVEICIFRCNVSCIMGNVGLKSTMFWPLLLQLTSLFLLFCLFSVMQYLTGWESFQPRSFPGFQIWMFCHSPQTFTEGHKVPFSTCMRHTRLSANVIPSVAIREAQNNCSCRRSIHIDAQRHLMLQRSRTKGCWCFPIWREDALRHLILSLLL